ncbi:MAG TPA: immunoglobulin-like domain-containing protein [Pyrinomonadaceae bacterium]|nr:immunoglobulin-like domain-containing protein [Pyrinomonadaceae bacterium]
MKTNLPPKTKSGNTGDHRNILKFPYRSVPLRALVILILAGLIVTGLNWSSSASGPQKASQKTDSAITQVSGETAVHGLPALGIEHFSSLFMVPPPPAAPTVTVYNSDCSTPQSVFNLQDTDKTVCAKVTGTQPAWRILWSNPSFLVAQNSPVGSGTSTFTLTAASALGDWRVILYDPNGGQVQAVATFTVIDAANPKADVIVSKGMISGSLSAGGQVVFSVQVDNAGPDAAAAVDLSDSIPINTSFVSFDQLSGPVFTCTNPTAGATSGSTSCTIASLARGATATFVATYQIGAVSGGTVISNTASVSSTTPDSNTDNNSSTAEGTVVGSPCMIASTDNITVDADAGQAGAVVTYTTPSYSGDCGTAFTDPESGQTIPVISCNPASGSFFDVGSTTVICVAQVGDVSTFQVTVNNPGGLSISVTGANPLTVECGATFSDPGATAVNGSGQSVPVTVSGPTIDRDTPAGTYTLTYTATEDPNSVSAERTVIVEDTEAPSITVDGANPYRIATGSCSPFVDPGVSANDGCAGAKPVTTTISGPGGATSVNTNVAGTYTVTYTATDGTHTATSHRDVIVGNFNEDEVDQPATSNVPPTVTLNGDDQMTIECGPFTDPGATAEVCGTSIPVTTTGTVDSHTPGIYSITYSATANGFTTSKTRTVTVEADNTAPTITLNGPNPTYVECHTGTYTELGAVAHDACAGDFPATASGSVNRDVVGSYTITYNATDPSGHAAAPVTRTVIVRDTTPPIVTAPANVTVNTGPGNTTCSVTVSDATLGTASANDACQGSLSTTRSGVPAGNVFTGTTTVTYSATDAAGNIGTATQTVTVVDTTPPTISCQANIVADYDGAVNGAVVTYTTPVGTDNCGATTTQIAGLPSGATFPAGTTTNTFRVTDGAGNSAQCSFTVTVALTSLIGLDSVTMSGSGYADSYSSAGGYPASKGSLANILSNGTITMGGSAKVWGNVRSTRANVSMTGSAQVTGNATAGTTVTTSGSATVLGTRTNNALAPVMTLPAVGACSPFSSNSGISGTYSYNAATGDLTLSGVNIATLANGNYCFHNVTLGNSAQLKVNGPVVIKMTGTLNTSGATNLNNTTQIPSNLRILSSYSGSNGIVLGNSVSVYALIYSPNTGLNLSGSAPLFGTFAGKTLIIGNSGAIHYDTQLKAAWPAVWALLP